MPSQQQALYAAFRAKDARFDGRFFVGIASTGIYCRPVCRAKPAKAENCSFYSSAAQAEQAGYRPCLLCRPELAPGTYTGEPAMALARRAARMLEENCSSGLSLESIARQLGCTARHLRRAFAGEYQVSPVQYLQTCRLLLAKSLLTDTALPVLDVAMAAGFGSLRRFNDLFARRYRLSPTALRRQTGPEKPLGGITLTLAYRPPYRWEEMLSFLARRAISGVEVVKNGEYLRTARFNTPGGGQACGWVRVACEPKKNALALTVSEALLPALPQVLARVRHLFDLYCDPWAVYDTLKAMNELKPGLCVPGRRLPGCFNAFEMALRAVLGQQITVKAASTLATRLAAAFGTPMNTGIEGLNYLFPQPECLLALAGPIENHLGPLGVTRARANTIQALAQALAQGEIQLGPCALPEEEMEKLMAIKGIGRWTAQYVAMRAMGWPDAFPETDAGIKQALAPRAPKEILALAEAWRPWRSYAAINLWNTL